jgi:integral membrane sensor domain MASE1
MKAFTYTLSIIAIILVVYNLTKIDYNSPLQGESAVALITVVAGLCAVLLLAILRTSRKIEKTLKKKS